jgi:hypothetical protein
LIKNLIIVIVINSLYLEKFNFETINNYKCKYKYVKYTVSSVLTFLLKEFLNVVITKFAFRETPTKSSLGAKAGFMSFNRTQARAVTGLLTGHNTLRRHLYLIGLSDSPLCRRCAAEDETAAHILCECEAMASLRHVYLGSFFLEPEGIKSISLGAIWNFSKATGIP